LAKKLTAETLSFSTADALEALNCLNVPEFKNGESYNQVISSSIDYKFYIFNFS